jgi:hypothetical protein
LFSPYLALLVEEEGSVAYQDPAYGGGYAVLAEELKDAGIGGQGHDAAAFRLSVGRRLAFPEKRAHGNKYFAIKI